MNLDLSPKSSASSSRLTPAVQVLARQARFQRWVWRADLPEHYDRFLSDLRQLLEADDCLLYLAGQTPGLLTLIARANQAQTPPPVQLAMPADLPWSQICEWWLDNCFAEVHAACQPLLASFQGQIRTTALAPLFPSGSTDPIGMLVIRTTGVWEQEQELLLSQVSTPLGIRLSEQHTREHDAQHRLIDTFVRLLCSPSFEPEQEEIVRNQARFLGLDLTCPHLVARARLAASQAGEAGMVQVFGHLKAELEPRFPGAVLLLQESSEIFCLLPLTGTSEQAVAQLKQAVRELQPRLQVLLGVSHPTRDLRDYARGWGEARDALASAKQARVGGVFPIQEVGPLRFLKLEEARGTRPTDRYTLAIQKLADYDQQSHADLVYTLEKFLLAGGRYSQAARMMEQEPGKAIAINTVRQRVERMCEITELDLLDSTLWLQLQLAIQIHRFQEM